jgi:hypothetical protein
MRRPDSVGRQLWSAQLVGILVDMWKLTKNIASYMTFYGFTRYSPRVVDIT